MQQVNPVTSGPEEWVMADISDGIGWITLNRPRALNALNLEMVRALQKVLDAWKDNINVRLVILKSSSEKSFCAGGDLKSVFEANKKRDWQHLDELFREEYTLDNDIFHYPKPYISYINGITMGGGMGISINGGFRVSTRKATYAMPETKIGYFPDVGATYFLNRCPGQLGLYIGLTGLTFSAEDAHYAGIVTHLITESQWDAFEGAVAQSTLRRAEDVEEMLQQYCDEQPQKNQCHFEKNIEVINSCFAQNTLEDIFKALKAHPSSFAQNTLQQLETRCPLSMKVTFQQLKLGKKLPFHQTMQQEFQQSRSFVTCDDFIEGIRAAVVDKDKSPNWSHGSIHEIDDEKIKEIFQRNDFKALEV